MLPECRAVVFDLDDTLYPYRRFRLSGFLAVARHLAATRGLDTRLGFAALVGASRSGHRGREIQACLEQHDVPAADLPVLVDVLRHHAPRLRLSQTTARMLATLRREGWRLGVLTNGQPTIQARKVAALGLAPLVDAVAYAVSSGRGVGKPDPEPFASIARELRVPPAQIVFVGDDERCDVVGALTAGMQAIRCATWVAAPNATAAKAVIARMTQVPAVARTLLERGSKSHAA